MNFWNRTDPIGKLAELMSEPERAMAHYEQALVHNPYSEKTLTSIAALCRSLEKYAKAAEYFQRILKIHDNNGEIWGALGHCYLMLDDLHKAYSAYQQALYHLPNPKEPKLWYGIGILYDRYGSFEHAEDAFTAVIEMDSKFEKANEIYFRLGVIYRQQGKFENAHECFKYIMNCPPPPLAELDILFQIGTVYDRQGMYQQAKETYERVLQDSPKHAKVLQQLGWLYQQTNTGFTNLETAVSYLNSSLENGTFL
jgi:tetratricopeptide (TPR) repeat protein